MVADRSLQIVVTSTFGLEAVVARELRLLGYKNLSVENGRILFSGSLQDIARCNIWLRAADRVVWEVVSFPAGDWDEFFSGVVTVPWEDILPGDARIHVTARSIKSRLFSVRTCQAMAKKAIVESLKRRHRDRWLPETGITYRIDVTVRHDVVTIGVDTTGSGLHKRGYRDDAGDAPLRENLAAGLVLLSRWDGKKPFADPLCGAGTIAIEAAMVAQNRAPGLLRGFAAEHWGPEWKRAFDGEKAAARNGIVSVSQSIMASDRDEVVLKKAMQNARRAGVRETIEFNKRDIANFTSNMESGYVVCNPPYGERMGDEATVEELYRALGRMRLNLPTWSFHILTAHPLFERFLGERATRNRKLFNGNLLCYLYEYLAVRSGQSFGGAQREHPRE
jgi:putative N6-adenine-specific DNA methylase